LIRRHAANRKDAGVRNAVDLGDNLCQSDVIFLADAAQPDDWQSPLFIP
jgi:hypothetical protein